MTGALASIQTWVIYIVSAAVNLALGMSVGIWAAVLIPGWRALLATPIRVDEEAIDQMSLLAEDRAELDALIVSWRRERRRAWWVIGSLTALWLVYPALLVTRAISDVGAMTLELVLVGLGFTVGFLGVAVKSLWTRSNLRPLVPVAADWRWATGAYRAREQELREAIGRISRQKADAERERATAERERAEVEREWVDEAGHAEQLQSDLTQVEEHLQAEIDRRDNLIAELNARLAPGQRLWLDGPEAEVEDPVADFRRQVDAAWRGRYSAADRAQWPLRPVVVGWDFLASLERHSFPREKLVEVCVDVITRRVHQITGREPHRLRIGAGGNDEVRVRMRDGAKAWRCALKRNAPQAPRLHWWELEGGGVELACVVGHDDFSIAE